MVDSPAAWSYGSAAAAIRDGDVGALIRAVRKQEGLSQAELGAAVGRSAAAVSRFERGLAEPRYDILRAYSEALRIPMRIVGVALRGEQQQLAAFGDHEPEGDAMERRAFLRAAALTIPAVALEAVDRALAAPREAGDRRPFRVVLREVRDTFNGGRIVAAVGLLPTLFARADELAATGEGDDLAAAAGAYDLATEMLAKVNLVARARVAADRSYGYATRSEQLLAHASSARCMSIVLRHDGSADVATDVTRLAAERLSTAGLSSIAEVSSYAQALSTLAYTSARAGRAAEADSAIAEAASAARRLPARAGKHRMSSSAVAVYEVGVRWALDDPGSALRAAGTVKPELLHTRERRARFHTDVARALHAVGRESQTALALARAARESQDEVLVRPEIRSIAREVLRANPRLSSSVQLATTLGLNSA